MSGKPAPGLTPIAQSIDSGPHGHGPDTPGHDAEGACGTSIIPAPGLTPGFTDPVLNAQSCFRAVLDAMARPGRVHTVSLPSAPPPLGAAAAAVLLTLIDHETPLWVDPALHGARDWITFHCGAPSACISQAAFAVALSMPDLPGLRPGTHETPEAAATLILQVASLSAGRRLSLRGPGLREPGIMTVDGLPDDFRQRWAANRALFPCGIDLILCAGSTLAALPRGIAIEDA